ncbi:MAG: hypothetical protein COA43_14465 [Robiginitomaculum sp.]|nr:MAG: hypothetical protein COA43_14465 [Robiginitomaculum sp.]
MTRSKFFTMTYDEARKMFLKAAEKLGAVTQSYAHPSECAPNGDVLTVDTAWVGPRDADVVLLCISGTHGPEGFCGSAAQIQSLQDGSLTPLPKGVAVLMVHALNPFGFAYMTRYNENNVDLNRNWVDFNTLPKVPALYDELYACLPPADQFDESLFKETVNRFAELVQKYGGFAVENALSAGQYLWPEGLGYGGCKSEWSSLVMQKILSNIDKKTRHIAYLDWHSLVRSGMDDMVYLCFNQPDDALFERCKMWWGADNVDPACVAKKWNAGLGRAGGRPSRHGIMMWGIQKYVAANQDVVGGVIEFTDALLDPLQQKLMNLRAMLLSRYFVHTRDISSRKGRILYDESRELWCPTCKDWQEKSLAHAHVIFAKTLAGAASWAAENTHNNTVPKLTKLKVDDEK